jgi:hypothetical protein
MFADLCIQEPKLRQLEQRALGYNFECRTYSGPVCRDWLYANGPDIGNGWVRQRVVSLAIKEDGDGRT